MTVQRGLRSLNKMAPRKIFSSFHRTRSTCTHNFIFPVSSYSTMSLVSNKPEEFQRKHSHLPLLMAGAGLSVSFIASSSQTECKNNDKMLGVPLGKFRTHEADQGPNSAECESKPLAVLVACGSFSPITNMHLRLFEEARNYLMIASKQLDVVGGLISPVHDAYGKKSLVDASYRVKMCQKAVKDSNWVDVSEWEVEQEGWTRTAKVLASYNKIINESGRFDSPVRCILLCGADLLESVLVPGLWQQSDLEYIFSECKIAVHKREGLDLEALIRENPFLYKHRDNILIIPQTIHNNISSTNIRNALKLGLSVKYLMPKAVTDYIYKHGLYGSITPP